MFSFHAYPYYLFFIHVAMLKPGKRQHYLQSQYGSHIVRGTYTFK